MGNRKHTIESVSKYFKDQGCELLATEYINNRTKMKYFCECKNESKITFANFKNGIRCMICRNKLLRHDFNSVKNFFKEQGCKLLETEYINSKTKMKYICKCGNESEIRFNDLKNGVRCMKCSGNEQLSYEYVQNFFKEQECQLLETEYINNCTNMKYICTCGNTSKIIFSSFKQGTRCSRCYGNEKLTYDFVYNYFKEQGCKLLETEYINSSIKLKYRCVCNTISEILFHDFKAGHRCRKCKNKTERKLLNWLINNYSFTIEHEKIFEWSKTEKSYLRYDFYIKELNLIIELDGEQHFAQVSNWVSPEINQINDELKNKLALENCYRMIRICQQIVWNDKEIWENQLKNAIENSNKELIKIGSIYN